MVLTRNVPIRARYRSVSGALVDGVTGIPSATFATTNLVAPDAVEAVDADTSIPDFSLPVPALAHVDLDSQLDTADHDGGAHDDLGVHVFSKDPLAPTLAGFEMSTTSG
jgi:hypothetical protein